MSNWNRNVILSDPRPLFALWKLLLHELGLWLLSLDQVSPITRLLFKSPIAPLFFCVFLRAIPIVLKMILFTYVTGLERTALLCSVNSAFFSKSLSCRLIPLTTWVMLALCLLDRRYCSILKNFFCYLSCSSRKIVLFLLQVFKVLLVYTYPFAPHTYVKIRFFFDSKSAVTFSIMDRLL